MENWKASNTENAKYIGIIEFQDTKGEWHNFEVLQTEDRLVFGSSCNVGFLESGYMELAESYSLDENLQAMLQDLEDYYNEGPDYPTFIICNERM